MRADYGLAVLEDDVLWCDFGLRRLGGFLLGGYLAFRLLQLLAEKPPLMASSSASLGIILHAVWLSIRPSPICLRRHIACGRVASSKDEERPEPVFEPITQNDEADDCRDADTDGAEDQHAGGDLFDSVAHRLATSSTLCSIP